MAFARPGGREEEAVFEYTPVVEPDADPGKAKKKIERETVASHEAGGKQQKEYEALGSALGMRAYEPPEQRLARLSAEVSDLLRLAESQSVEDAAHDGHNDFRNGDPSAVAAELRVMEQRLAGLARDGTEFWRSRSETGSVGARHAAAGSLAAQLEKLAAGNASALEMGGGSDGRVTYEICYTPASSTVVDSSKIASLEGTLASIEKQLGVFDQTCPFSDLQSAVMLLQRRLAALDNQKLESIRVGVHKTMGDVEAVLQKKHELDGADDDPELDRKTNELYEFCHRWNAVAPVLPTIITRLQALQALHQESSSFASRLAALEQQQEELAKLLESTNSAVSDLGNSLKENMTIMRDSMQSFEAKISKAVQA